MPDDEPAAESEAESEVSVEGHRLGRRRIRLLLVAVVLTPVLAAAALVIDGLTDSARTSDAIVVLGNEVLADGRPSARLAARLDTAVALYDDGLADAVIVSGGVGESGFDEAAVMADYLIANGVPEDAVIEDGEGITTRATAENTARIFDEEGWTSAIVVTQYFHVSRSRLALRQAGIDPVTTAHADHVEARDLYSLVREVPAYARYLLG